MSKGLRRFEVLLPLRFNDGRPVPNELIAQTLLEIEEHFGAVSGETQTIRGFWRHEGQSFRDDLTRIFVDAPDTAESEQYFETFKEVLKARFEQVEIWITTHPVKQI
jgi:hypothetical protein